MKNIWQTIRIMVIGITIRILFGKEKLLEVLDEIKRNKKA